MTSTDRTIETARGSVELTPEKAETAQLIYDILASADGGTVRIAERLTDRPPSGRAIPYPPPDILVALALVAEWGCFEQSAQEVIDGENVTITLSPKGEEELQKYRELFEQAKAHGLIRN